MRRTGDTARYFSQNGHTYWASSVQVIKQFFNQVQHGVIVSRLLSHIDIHIKLRIGQNVIKINRNVVAIH